MYGYSLKINKKQSKVFTAVMSIVALYTLVTSLSPETRCTVSSGGCPGWFTSGIIQTVSWLFSAFVVICNFVIINRDQKTESEKRLTKTAQNEKLPKYFTQHKQLRIMNIFHFSLVAETFCQFTSHVMVPDDVHCQATIRH